MTIIILVTVLFFKEYIFYHIVGLKIDRVFFYFMTGTSVKMPTKKPLGCHSQMLRTLWQGLMVKMRKQSMVKWVGSPYYKGHFTNQSFITAYKTIIFQLLFDLILYTSQQFFSHVRKSLPGWTSTKQRIKGIAQRCNTVPPVRLEPATP